MGAPATAGVVLVEYFSNGLTADRVAAVERLGYTAIVADNSAVYRGPGCVVSTGGNVGFGVANNQAVASLDPRIDVVVFMNPDTLIESEHLNLLVARVASGEWDALVPATLVRGGERLGFALPGSMHEVLVTGNEWAMSHGLKESPHAVPDKRSGRREKASRPREIPGRFGSAALLVVSRQAFECVGGFDDRFFLYVEDADLWDRLGSEGFRLGFDSAVKLSHLSGQGSSGSTARRAALRRLGVETYLQARGRSFTAARLAHRVVPLPIAARAGDPIIDMIRSGYRGSLTPTAIQCRVRSIALAEAPT